MVVTINPTAVSILPLLVFIVPLVFGALIFALGRFGRFFRQGLALIGILATLLISVMMTGRVLGGEVLTWWSNNLYIDGLATLMELAASVMGVIVVAYSIYYFSEKTEAEEAHPYTSMTTYYGQILLFLGLMNWTCATNNIIMMYVSLEFTTLATVFLVTFHWNKPALEAGYKYLLLVTVGVIFALLGSVLLYAAAIKFLPVSRVLLLTELGTVATKIPTNIVLLAAAFLVVGFGTKAGLVPFHAWLPDAHAEAPAPVSALLSGIVIKVGAYALARTISVFAPHYGTIPLFIAILCSLSMLVGMMMAMIQDDLKRMLAYSSVAQIAYVIEGLGMGSYLGIYGGLMHLLNHSIVKGLLFLSVGAIIYSTGKRKVSGLAKTKLNMPVTAFAFFVGIFALSGMPPFNGFVSKFTLFLAVGEAKLLWAAIIGIITSLFTLVCFFRAGYKIFWSPKEVHAVGAEAATAGEVPAGMWAGMVILAVAAIVLGVFPQIVHPLLDSATKCILRILIGG
jgi:formate hydrogenlyase subunit 3/multisubunit Na+/H+ antiporter MnhD subunit